MRTTKQEREKAKQGCDFYHHGICVHERRCNCIIWLKAQKLIKRISEQK